MEDLTNDSPIGRPLAEISWEGSAVRYRQGGRGRENVLTTQVFALLDLLPRGFFWAEVLRAATGAGSQRAEAAAAAEDARFQVLPGDTHAVSADKRPSSWTVQPDVTICSARSTVWVEAKRIRRSSFQRRQLARSVAALTSTAGDRSPLLLLVLAEPPPITVSGIGRVDLADALRLSADDVSDVMTSDELLAAGDCMAWITWRTIAESLGRADSAYDNSDPSTLASVRRTSGSLLRAISWHS